jgi:hypothetical protein
MESKYIHKIFSFKVDTPGTSYSKKFDLDKNVRVVLGLLMSSDDPRKLFFRGSQRIEISGDELYSEDYESKLLMSGISVSPNDKYLNLGNGVLSGNGEVKILYKDTESVYAQFEPYRVSLVLKCELK